MPTVFTHVGKNVTTDRIAGVGVAEPNYVAWGTGVTAAAVGDTVIETESAEARVLGTGTQETTAQTNDTYQVIGTITSAGTQTIANAGLLTAVTGGSLYLHGDFTGIPLALNDAIQFTMSVQYTD